MAASAYTLTMSSVPEGLQENVNTFHYNLSTSRSIQTKQITVVTLRNTEQIYILEQEDQFPLAVSPG